MAYDQIVTMKWKNYYACKGVGTVGGRGFAPMKMNIFFSYLVKKIFIFGNLIFTL